MAQLKVGSSAQGRRHWCTFPSPNARWLREVTCSAPARSFRASVHRASTLLLVGSSRHGLDELIQSPPQISNHFCFISRTPDLPARHLRIFSTLKFTLPAFTMSSSEVAASILTSPAPYHILACVSKSSEAVASLLIALCSLTELA